LNTAAAFAATADVASLYRADATGGVYDGINLSAAGDSLVADLLTTALKAL
jgi:hypothetical protein